MARRPAGIRPQKLGSSDQELINKTYSGMPCPDMTADDMQEVRELVQAARTSLSMQFPYLRTLLYRVQIILSRDCPALMAVDRYWRCHVRPDAILALGNDRMKEITGVLMHELFHLILNHAQAAEEHGVTQETHMAANVAMDMPINKMAADMGLSLPPWVIRAPSFGYSEGHSWQQYWDLLRKDFDEITMDMLLGSGYACSVGSGADGQDHDHEGKKPAPNKGETAKGQNGKDGKAGEFDDPSSSEWQDAKVNEVEADAIRKEVAEAIQNARQQGNVPAELVVWADEALKPPKIPWHKEFRCVLRGMVANGNSDETYDRRNKNQQQYGRIIVPGRQTYQPRVGINMDTSGSMWGRHTRAMSEVEGVIKEVTSVELISCDADVHERQTIRSAKKAQLIGGGGTDMGRGLEYFANEVSKHERPDIVITITDGYTCWPDRTDWPFKHICLMVDANGNAPPFGKVFYVTDDD